MEPATNENFHGIPIDLGDFGGRGSGLRVWLCRREQQLESPYALLLACRLPECGIIFAPSSRNDAMIR
jgi:hypothetical protein